MLWQKIGTQIDEKIQSFLAADDVLLDRYIFLHDIKATKAHVNGLSRIGIINGAECSQINSELENLQKAFSDGTFCLDNRFEDGHTAIEVYLTQNLGEMGKKVHTGRSRNDQVLVALRMYMRESLERLESILAESTQAFLEKSQADLKTPMPGYTHLQRAVPSTIGLWMLSFAESFIDNIQLAKDTFKWLNSCPLGTAAGYGVNIPLDREGVAKELGFNRLQINPMYAQNSRGKHELQVLSVISQALLDVRRLAWDLSLFTTAEFGFVKLPAAYTTGSSIMPNKRNPDVIELLRSTYACVHGAICEIQSILSLPSGYHRDLQAIKKPFITAVERSLQALELIPELVKNLEFDKDKMKASISREMYATDEATRLASEGLPFRQAYQQVAEQLGNLECTPEHSIENRISAGACGNAMLHELMDRFNLLAG